jgi:hypothetical protein
MYSLLHWLYAIFIALILLFEQNILHLFIVLIIISIQTYSIILFRKCPLTLLERKHEKKTNHKKYLQKVGIDFKCNHEYESSIETMILIWVLLSLKIFILILKHSFFNNDLYDK